MSNQFKSILDSISSEYNTLLDYKSKLEADCQKLNEFTDIQISQIQQLSADFKKLRQDFAMRQEACQPKPVLPPAQSMLPPVPPIPQTIDDQHIPMQQQQMPPQQETDDQDQNWEITILPGATVPQTPDQITLLAEIVDVSVVCSTAFSPDNTSLAIGSNKTLRVYDIEREAFTLEFTIDGNDEPNHIRSVAWTPDSRYIICGGEDHNIRIFDMNDNGSLKATFEAGNGEIFQLQCARNGKFFVAVTGDGVLTMWDLSPNDPMRRYQKMWEARREADISRKIIAASLSLSDNDRFVAVGYDDNYVAIWDLEARICACKKEAHTNGVYGIKFIPGDKRLATASSDCTVKLWDIIYTNQGIEMNLWKTLTGHTNYALCLATDPSGKWLLSGSKDLHVILTNLERGEMVYKIRSHTNSIITVSFNASGNLFATGSGDKCIKIWNFIPTE